MHIAIKWFSNQFNISLASKEGAEEFLSIKGCRIKEHEGKKFVAFPSTKNATSGKWWAHAWANEKFQAEVIRLAEAGKPNNAPPSRTGGLEKMPDDIPF